MNGHIPTYAAAVHGLGVSTPPPLPGLDQFPGRDPFDHAAILIHIGDLSPSDAIYRLSPTYRGCADDAEFESVQAFTEAKLVHACNRLDHLLAGKPYTAFTPPAPVAPPPPPPRPARDPIRRQLTAFAFGLFRANPKLAAPAYLRRMAEANANLGGKALSPADLKSLALFVAKTHHQQAQNDVA